MAPHLDNVELDMVTRLSAEKNGPEEILAAISKRRRKMKIATPKIWAVSGGLLFRTTRSQHFAFFCMFLDWAEWLD